MWKSGVVALSSLFLGLAAPPSRAADHADAPLISLDPPADIGDVFAWMSPDARQLNLVMGVVRNATPRSRFSDSVDYVFHTSSSASYGVAASPDVDIVCDFNKKQKIRCRIAQGKRKLAQVSGDASREHGIQTKDGKLRVFAGLREDPFFFNAAGFRETARIVTAAADGLSFDAAGCPALDTATSAALVGQLQSAPGGGPAVDAFAGFNALAIVLSIDVSLLTKGGPILSVWGSTNRDGRWAPSSSKKKSKKKKHGGDDDYDDEDDYDLRRPMPKYGKVQLDRMGRAGVNTALTSPFFRESVPAEKLVHDRIVDAYNAEAWPGRWVRKFAPGIAGNLAIFDALDTVCGNQLLAGPAAEPGRYDTLATVLADDQLYVNTRSGVCQQYLAVEANAVGIANDDCGGRTPLYDTIDTTYSLLAIGALSGVTDGVPIDGEGVASLTRFPFLDRPNP